MKPIKKIPQENIIDAWQIYSDEIFRYCYYRVFERERAKKLTHTVFQLSWQEIAPTSATENIKISLFKTARKVIAKEISTPGSFWRVSQLLNIFRHRQEHQDFIDIMRQIEERYRDAMVLKHINQLTIEELSAVLGKTSRDIEGLATVGLAQANILLKNRLEGFVPARGYHA